MSTKPKAPTEKIRCGWSLGSPEYIEYHDRDWGVPVHDDRLLFEMLTLEGAQAGLAWITILRKRAGYRAAFANFDPKKVARFGPADVERLLADPGIVRNRLKIESTLDNARAFLAVKKEKGSFAAYLWSFVDGKPVQSARKALGDVPPQTPLAELISKDLKHRGFRFVGPTIIYAYLQAVGVVNDHLLSCFRRAEVGRE
ncbi:MAG TPA: DNA-3-methyladenine glycosylase I [Thermoanaerobaculia bacterium]|jgi:DNA-3-methyladenine glycosylase I|nr:DNA-3-methyladenine glycosylase I [Thermoanaerobaculia bacterium]